MEADRIQQCGQVAFVAGEGLGTGVEGCFGHGDIVHLGRPVGEVARVVRPDASQLEGGDEFQEHG